MIASPRHRSTGDSMRRAGAAGPAGIGMIQNAPSTRRRLISLGASLLLLGGGCIRPAEIPDLNTDELALVLSRLVLQPRMTCAELRRSFGVEYLPLVDTPDEIGLRYGEFWVPTDDGELLRVWYLPSKLQRGVVILSGGAAGTLPCFLFHAQLLVDNGWSVVMYEYRGFGESTGAPDITTLPTDLEAVLDWTRAQIGGRPVTLMGISLGSVPSIAVAAARPQAVNGLVLDSPVAMASELSRLDFVLGDRTQEFIDRLPKNLVSERVIARVHQPLLVLAGQEDALTTPATVQDLFNRAGGPRSLVLFPGIDHARAIFVDTGTYAYAVESFLSAIWDQREPLQIEIIADRGP